MEGPCKAAVAEVLTYLNTINNFLKLDLIYNRTYKCYTVIMVHLFNYRQCITGLPV